MEPPTDDTVRVAPAEMDVLVTPEPTGLTLGALGALALAGYGWRRRRKAASS